MIGGRTVTIVAAVAADGTIGDGGGMPWRIPAELAHFRKVTTGRPVVMGRKTWDSLPKGLPGRTCHVATTRPESLAGTGAVAAVSVEAALRFAATDGDPIVAGGASVYERMLVHPATDEMLISEVDLEPGGDVSFPTYDLAEWRLADVSPWHEGKGGRWRVLRRVRVR